MQDLYTWTPLSLSVGLLLSCLLLARQHPLARVTASALCLMFSIRYVYWRVVYSMPPVHGFGRSWALTFLVAEIGVICNATFTQFFMSRHIDRSGEADARQNSRLLNAPADVFIATYNEESDILERTIVGAMAINHPDLRVWVLDDGAREWVRQMAEELGAHYVCRMKGKHAKAGNVNNGLEQALGTGRRPEFLLLLDADFVPQPTILQRTLGLFEDPTVGIVQTPQHFFNPDPLQSNLLCQTVWPDEQRFFFNVLLPSKDAWGAAFCCGTSAVFRVRALEAAGGMAIETVTEDMLTSFKLEEYGYRTIFLNERLSLGLAPEGLKEYISQRSRWCLGAIQQIFTRWSFLGSAKIGWISRLSFLDTVLYWMAAAPFKLLVVAVPMVYWLTGASVLQASAAELVFWMVPAVGSNILFIVLLSRNRILPGISDVTQLLTAFVICRTVVAALVRPFGRPFKVTAKGLSRDHVIVHWHLLWPFATLAALTVLGLLLHLPAFDAMHGKTGYQLNVIWSIVNAAMLLLAASACIEMPRRRRDERFRSADWAFVQLDDGSQFRCTVADISLSGARLTRIEGWRGLVGPAELVLGNGRVAIPFTVARRADQKLGVSFNPDIALRHALIRELFSGRYHNEIEDIHGPRVLGAMLRALVS